jgi:glutathione S-transferase
MTKLQRRMGSRTSSHTSATTPQSPTTLTSTSQAGSGLTGPRKYNHRRCRDSADQKRSFITYLESTATPLIDLSLYVFAENYNKTTSSAYTAILPWFANYTVPPKRRDLARARTARMGVSSLDVDTTAEEGFAPGRGTASSEYEAAKRAAGIPTETKPSTMKMGPKAGLGGLFGGQAHVARFRLDALASELLDPLSAQLGRQDYLFGGKQPSSLDCLAFGYLSLLYYPAVPNAWLKDTIVTKYPRIAAYIRQLSKDLFRGQEVYAANVWAISTGATTERESLLPWAPRSQTFASNVLAGAKEMLGNIPGISAFSQKRNIVSEPLQVSKGVRSELPSSLFVNSMLGVTAAVAVGLATLAIRHRRSPREGELIFWALRPATGFGEAQNILGAFADQLHEGGLY